MAGTITVTKEHIRSHTGNIIFEKVTATCVADASDGSFPATAIPLCGKIARVVSIPGVTAPTDNWDFTMIDSETAALDVFGGAGANRDTANAEQFLPVISLFPMSLCGVYNLTITGNSVNSANIVIIIYVYEGSGE